jgi:hypothetical protein
MDESIEETNNITSNGIGRVDGVSSDSPAEFAVASASVNE